MKNRIYRTFCLTKECKNILIIFVVINLFYTLSGYLLKLIFSSHGDLNLINTASFGKAIAVQSLIFMFLTPFINAGIYGITFLKMNSKKIGIRQFFFLAKSNYKIFFCINLLIIIILAIISVCGNMIYVKFFMPSNYSMNPYWHYYSIVSLIINIFFVFSLPLVTVGFFANQKLKPIRSSFAIIIKDFSKVRFIIVALFLEYAIKVLSKTIIPSSYTKIYLPIVTAVITFVVLIYSFLLITECFYKDLNFNFEIKTLIGENKQ